MCTSCDNHTYLIKDTYQCVADCPLDLYLDNITRNCAGCTNSCATCVNSSTNCTSCLNNLTLYNSTCLKNCPVGYYSLYYICQPCNLSNINCISCTSAVNCTSCSNFLYNGYCVD